MGTADIAKDRLYFILSIDRSNPVCEFPNNRSQLYYSGHNRIVFDEPITVLSDELLSTSYDVESGRWSACIHKNYYED